MSRQDMQSIIQSIPVGEIARRAGVSKTAVSLWKSGKYCGAETTRQAIEKAVRDWQGRGEYAEGRHAEGRHIGLPVQEDGEIPDNVLRLIRL
jgi:hypothetical protein